MLDSRKCLIVGEVAQAHDGSLGMAHAFIDAIANAGADAVKFQTHIAAAESTREEPWRVKFSTQDASRFDYWKRTGFNENEWKSLKAHADDRGLYFLSSPFSLEAFDLLHRVGVAAWKVASGEISNDRLLDAMAATGLTILLSTGMSTLDEVDRVVARVRDSAAQLVVMQCTSAYPCSAEKVGLNMIPFYRDRYGCSVGLSDHSGTIFPGLAAAVLGIEVLEVHVTLTREMFGPDVAASVTTTELRQLVEGVRFIEKMKATPVSKELLTVDMQEMRSLFTKSVVSRVPIEAGTVIQERHLALKKPGTGIPAERLSKLVGRTLRRDVVADELIREEDLSPGD